MKYRKGYKYQLAEDEWFYDTGIYPQKEIRTQFIWLDTDGTLVVKSGYATDGPSGPTIDRKCNMRGALGHDALCQLMRQCYLPVEFEYEAAELLERWWVEDGMNPIIAKIETYLVKKFGGFAVNPKNDKKIYEAP